jgi:hypothetical protein
VGLIIERDRLIAAGRCSPFAEILQVVHTHSALSVESEGGPPLILHVWTVRLQLLGGSIVLRTSRQSHPEGVTHPRPRDAYGQLMARAITWAQNLWLSSVPPSKLAPLRADLLRYHRYRPRPPLWQTWIGSPVFSFVALWFAGVAGVWFAHWLR